MEVPRLGTVSPKERDLIIEINNLISYTNTLRKDNEILRSRLTLR